MMQFVAIVLLGVFSTGYSACISATPNPSLDLKVILPLPKGIKLAGDRIAAPLYAAPVYEPVAYPAVQPAAYPAIASQTTYTGFQGCRNAGYAAPLQSSWSATSYGAAPAYGASWGAPAIGGYGSYGAYGGAPGFAYGGAPGFAYGAGLGTSRIL